MYQSDTPVTAKSRRTHYEELRTAMLTERSSFEAHWRDLADYFLPRRPRWQITDKNRGDPRSQHIIDSSPRFAARTLGSGMHAGLTSPARPWMRLTMADSRLAEDPEVKIYLHEVTRLMLSIFNRSNLYNVLPVTYGDMGIFGTAAMGVFEDTKDVMRCYSYPIGSYVFALDSRGVPCTFSREYEMTVLQVVDQFGTLGTGMANGKPVIDRTRLSARVLNDWDRGNYSQPVSVIWMVTPNTHPNPRSLWPQERLKYRSCYYERDTRTSSGDEDKFLKESGYAFFPVLCPRWDVTGEDTYGTDCPGMTCLPDNKALQLMRKRKAQAIEKMVNPPVVGPESLRTQKTSLLPGEITYVDTREGMQGLRAVHEVRVSIKELNEDIQDTRYLIQRAFFEDLFLMLANTPSTQPVTAREVEERHEEKLLALGPVLERTNDELLDPLIDRVWDIMDSAGLLPDAPQSLQGGAKLDVEYVSLMAQAQKLVGVVGLDRFMLSYAQTVQVAPDAAFKIDIFAVVDEYQETLGVNPNLVVPTAEAEEARAAAQEAAQKAQQAEAMQKMGTTAAQLGSTPPLSSPSMLSDVLGAGAGAAGM